MMQEAPELSTPELNATVDELVRLAKEGDEDAIVGLLSERVPGSLIGQAPPPDFTAVL